jgi:NifU-like protein
MWEYTDKVREAFLNPKNVGEIADADAVGEVGSIICGDALKLFLRIDRESGRITDAKFQTFGCASAIASSSALTELIKGKTLDEALQVTNQDIADFLGGLPEQKMHCSVLGRDALEAAIGNYRGFETTKKSHERIVCKCFDVTEEKIRRVAAENHLITVDEITNFTKAGGGCGSCRDDIQKILSDIWTIKEPPAPAEPRRLTNLQKIALIQNAFEREIRPGLQADGGDAEIVDIEGNRVLIELRGRCSSCMMSDSSLRSIQKRLSEITGQEIIVGISR